MTEAIVDELELIDVDHEQREKMFGAQRAIRLGLEPLVEVAPVKEPRERIGLGEPEQCLTLLLLHETCTDVSRDDLERREVGLFERTTIEAVRDVQHATSGIVDHDRDGHERVRSVLPATHRDGSISTT